MGFYSDVQITAESKAFEMFLKALERFGLNFSKKEIKDYGVIVFDWCKWYPDSEYVKEVEQVMNALSREHDDEKGYGYKMVLLNEDDTHEEWCNTRGFERFMDFFVSCHIDNPYLREDGDGS